MNPKRILYINGGIMAQGGIESFMMNYYRHIDRNKIQIDFVVHGFEKGYYDDEIKALGGVIYNIPVKSKNYNGNIKSLKKIFNSKKYVLIHSHLDAMNTVVLRIAKQCGIPIRIAHSHNTNHLTNNKLKIRLNEIARKNIKKYATHLFACSEDAGRWLFGDKAFENGEILIINNAIDLDNYKFDKDIRLKMRKKLNLETETVYGHVGRFDYQKNHEFILEVFKEVVKEKPDSKLLLVGNGHLKEKILNQVNNLKLSDNVILMGTRSDIADLVSVMDVFIFPSLFEGLGMVLIEAQANGLNCIASTNLPKEVRQTELVTFLSLSLGAKKWADHILNLNVDRKGKENVIKLLTDSGYNINHEVKKLEKKYISLIDGVSN